MKIYKTIKVPETAREVLVERHCDLCGKKSKSSDWDAGVYEVNETEIKILIKQKSGASYPEGGFGTKYEIDLCPECFMKRLIPWLRSEGAEVEEYEWDY